MQGLVIVCAFFVIVWCLMAVAAAPGAMVSLAILRLLKNPRMGVRLLSGALLAGVYILLFLAWIREDDLSDERRLWLIIWFVFLTVFTNLPLFISKELGWRITGIILGVVLTISCFMFLASKPFPV